jgi:hypothetical protein
MEVDEQKLDTCDLRSIATCPLGLPRTRIIQHQHLIDVLIDLRSSLKLIPYVVSAGQARSSATIPYAGDSADSQAQRCSRTVLHNALCYTTQ